MKKKLFVLAACSFGFLAGPVLAECPSSLNAEQMIECITTEDAGYSYGNESTQDDAVSGLASQDANASDSSSSSTVAVLAKNKTE